MLQNLNMDNLVDELCENGLGQDFHKVFIQGHKVDIAEFSRWIYTESNGNNAIDFMETKFK